MITDVAEVAAGAGEPAVAEAAAAVAGHAVPVGVTGVAVSRPSLSTESPGSGKARSAES